MTSPREIADSLTGAQRWSFLNWLGKDQPLRAVTVFQHHSNMEDLRGMGLIKIKRASIGFFRNRNVITPLGRAVAKELESGDA